MAFQMVDRLVNQLEKKKHFNQYCWEHILQYANLEGLLNSPLKVYLYQHSLSEVELLNLFTDDLNYTISVDGLPQSVVNLHRQLGTHKVYCMYLTEKINQIGLIVNDVLLVQEKLNRQVKLLIDALLEFKMIPKDIHDRVFFNE